MYYKLYIYGRRMYELYYYTNAKNFQMRWNKKRDENKNPSDEN